MAEESNTQSKLFIWEGFNEQGQREKGEISAASAALAQTELKRRSINAFRITPKAKPLLSFGKRKKKITQLDILLFTRQLATMLDAGLPMVKAFEIVGKGHDNPSMEELIFSMKSHISSGQTFAATLAQYPKYFDNLYCSLIDAGERSGTLETMLNGLANYLEKTQTLKKKIKKAMMYPSVVFGATFIAAGILLLFVVPRFQETFSSFGAELPMFTQMIVNLSKFLQKFWWLILAFLGLTFFCFKLAKKRSEKFAYTVDRCTLKLPVVGIITQKAIVARFTRTLATTLAAGMPIIDAIDCVNNIIENRIYKTAITKLRTDISAGQQMNVSLEQSKCFPNLVIKMIAVGEESGSLENMLGKVASYFEEDVDSMVDNLSALLEPLIMIVLGVIIGGFVIAMYLPIFRLGSAIKG